MKKIHVMFLLLCMGLGVACGSSQPSGVSVSELTMVDPIIDAEAYVAEQNAAIRLAIVEERPLAEPSTDMTQSPPIDLVEFVASTGAGDPISRRNLLDIVELDGQLYLAGDGGVFLLEETDTGWSVAPLGLDGQYVVDLSVWDGDLYATNFWQTLKWTGTDWEPVYQPQFPDEGSAYGLAGEGASRYLATPKGVMALDGTKTTRLGHPFFAWDVAWHEGQLWAAGEWPKDGDLTLYDQPLESEELNAQLQGQVWRWVDGSWQGMGAFPQETRIRRLLTIPDKFGDEEISSSSEGNGRLLAQGEYGVYAYQADGDWQTLVSHEAVGSAIAVEVIEPASALDVGAKTPSARLWVGLSDGAGLIIMEADGTQTLVPSPVSGVDFTVRGILPEQRLVVSNYGLFEVVDDALIPIEIEAPLSRSQKGSLFAPPSGDSSGLVSPEASWPRVHIQGLGGCTSYGGQPVRTFYHPIASTERQAMVPNARLWVWDGVGRSVNGATNGTNPFFPQSLDNCNSNHGVWIEADGYQTQWGLGVRASDANGRQCNRYVLVEPSDFGNAQAQAESSFFVWDGQSAYPNSVRFYFRQQYSELQSENWVHLGTEYSIESDPEDTVDDGMQVQVNGQWVHPESVPLQKGTAYPFRIYLETGAVETAAFIRAWADWNGLDYGGVARFDAVPDGPLGDGWHQFTVQIPYDAPDEVWVQASGSLEGAPLDHLDSGGLILGTRFSGEIEHYRLTLTGPTPTPTPYVEVEVINPQGTPVALNQVCRSRFNTNNTTSTYSSCTTDSNHLFPRASLRTDANRYGFAVNDLRSEGWQILGVTPEPQTRFAEVTIGDHNGRRRAFYGWPYWETGGRSAVVVVRQQTADLSIQKVDAVDPVLAGDPIEWQLTVSNVGSDDASWVQVVDSLPDGVIFVSASGAGFSCAYNEANHEVICQRNSGLGVGATAVIALTVQTAETTEGVLTNTATVSGDLSDPDESNNTDTEETAVERIADVGVQKWDTSDPVRLGGTLQWAFWVTNEGPSTAENVVLTDPLPAGVVFQAVDEPCTYDEATHTITCALGDIPANAPRQTVYLQVGIPWDYPLDEVVNTVTISSDTPDPDLSNNSDTEQTDVLNTTDLSINKSASLSSALPDESYQYYLDVVNGGDNDAFGVTVVDTLPAEVVYLRHSAPDWSCDYANQALTCFRPDMLRQTAPSRITIDVAVVTNTVEGTTVINTAEVSNEYPPDDDLSNNIDSESTLINVEWRTVSPVGYFYIHKAFDPDILPEEESQLDHPSEERIMTLFQAPLGIVPAFHLEERPFLCLSNLDPCPEEARVMGQIVLKEFEIVSMYEYLNPEAEVELTRHGEQIMMLNRYAEPNPANCIWGRCMAWNRWAEPRYGWELDEYVWIGFYRAAAREPTCASHLTCAFYKGAKPTSYTIEMRVTLEVSYDGFDALTQSYDMTVHGHVMNITTRILPHNLESQTDD